MSDDPRAWDRSKEANGSESTSTQLQAAQDRWRHAEEENQRLRAQIEEILGRQDDLLRQSSSQQAYFQAVLRQLPAGVVVAEVPSGRVLFRNRQVELIFRQQLADAGNVLQPHGAAGFHRDGRQYHSEEWPLVRAIRQGEIVKDEHIGMVRGDGSCAVISISASPIRNAEGQITAAVAIDHDVTDLYMAREELRQIHEYQLMQRKHAEVERERLLAEQARQREFLQNLIDTSPIGIAVCQGPEFRILLTNPAYRAFWPDRPLLGRTLAEALPEVVANFTPEQLQAVLRAGQADRFREYPMPNQGGREQTWWNVDRIPLRNEQGQYDLVLVMVQDVTDYVLARRQVEQTAAHLTELNETLERRVAERTAVAEQRAAQLQKLAGELTRVEERERRRLAEVLHDDLQQLLVGAKFSTSMAKARISDQAVREALQRVNELLDESIQASRSLTTELSPPIVYQADLPGILQWLARWMQEKHGLEVEVRVEPAIDPQAEETRIVLFHAVRELLLNVAKHAEVNRATVRLEGSEDSYVRVSVQDKGVGFDPGQMDLQRQAGGGFGLFSIQERLIMLGGRMEIQSAPGAGTKATLWAPLRRGALPEEDGGALTVPVPFMEGEDLEAVPVGQTAALRVLLADDHEVVRNGLARLLQTQSGIEVVAQASDGQMAVDLARQVRPDVIVMDVTMPRLDGVEATRRIKRELPYVRVVGLSMHAEADMAERMVQAGATAYLAKSSAPDELVAAIRMAGRSNDGGQAEEGRRGDAGTRGRGEEDRQ